MNFLTPTPMPYPLQIFFVALLGLAFGSFGTMLLDRLPTGETFLGRSRCPHCGDTIATRDLIPLISFLLLSGQCRSCKKQISWRYPLFEALTTLVFLLVFTRVHGPWALLLSVIIASYSLLLIAFYDFVSQRIPDAFIVILFLAALSAALVQSMELSTALRDAFLGAAIPFTFFGLLWLLSDGRWIGSGDILLGTSIGILLGVSLTIVSLFLAYMLGALVASILIMTKRVRKNHTIAFGPFLVTGTLVALFFGETLLREYQRLLL